MGGKMSLSKGLSSDILTIGQLLKLGDFLPASVQRTYQWRQSDCQTLLNDIERAWRSNLVEKDDVEPVSLTENGELALAEFVPVIGEAKTRRIESYFLGSFILRPRKEEGCYEIFDGLQRFTTLTILLAVLRDLISQYETEIGNAIDEFIHKLDGQARLNLGGDDQTLANLVQLRSEAIRSRRNLSANQLRGRLLGAANVFNTALKDWPVNDLLDMSAFLLNNTMATLVRVCDERLARQIFITTNNRGLALSETDVLRSQINSIAARQDIANDALAVWQGVEAGFEDRQNYQSFLHAVDFLSRRKGPSAEGLTDLGEFLSQNLDDTRLLDWLENYQDQAEAWHWLKDLQQDPMRNKPFGPILFRLNVFNWNEWEPIALVLAQAVLFAKKEKNKRRLKTLESRFVELEKACAKFTLAQIGQAERVSLFARALSELKANRSPFNSSLSLSEKQIVNLNSNLQGSVFDPELVLQVLLWCDADVSMRTGGPVERREIGCVVPPVLEEGHNWKGFENSPEIHWRVAHEWGNFVTRELNEEDTRDDNFPAFKAFKSAHAKDKMKSPSLTHVLKQSQWSPDSIQVNSKRIVETIRARLS